MRIGRIRRLIITYAFFKALGAKNHNFAMAVVHECGVVEVVAGKMTGDSVKAAQSDIKSGGYDYEHKTT